MRILRSRKAEQSVVQFLIGLILVCIVIYTFSRIITSCIKPEDRSSKTFQALADKIALDTENLVGVQKELTPTFMNLAKDEILLFFDKGENYSVYFPAKSDLSLQGNFFSYHEQPVSYYYSVLSADSKEWLADRHVVSTGSVDMIYVFEKPRDCGDSACMVLCKEKNLKIILYSSHGVRFSSYEVTLPKPVFVKCTSSKQLRTFDNIEKFSRKPFFTFSTYYDGDEKKEYYFGRGLWDTDEAGKYFNAGVVPGAFFSSKFFCPAISSESGDKGPDETLNTIGRWAGKLSFNCLLAGGTTRDSSSDIISVNEYKDSEWQKISLLSGQYIFTQAFNSSAGNNVVLCYSPPCLNLQDEMYINWQAHIAACFRNSGCALLNDDIVRYAAKNKIVMKISKNAQGEAQFLDIQQGNNAFTYNLDDFNLVGDLQLQLEYHKEDKTIESINAAELSLNYDSYAGGNDVRVDVGDRRFSFTGAAFAQSVVAADIGPVPIPTLKFIVTEYSKPSTN